MNMFGLIDAPTAPVTQTQTIDENGQQGADKKEQDPLKGFRELKKKTQKEIENEYEYMKIASDGDEEKLWRSINLSCRFKWRDHYYDALSYFSERMKGDGYDLYIRRS